MSYRFSLLLAGALVTGCGSSDTFKNGAQPQGQGADATKGGTPAPAANTTDGADLNCSGIVLHGDHQSCDQADIDVAEGKAATVDNPAPAPASEAPKAPAPASTTTTASKPTSSDATAGTTTSAATSSDTGTATTTSTTSTSGTAATSTATATDPNVVEFHIKAGTGSAGYNTAATPVTVKVGQTLRLFNDDTIAHRLHTGGAPCPHQPGNTAPGASFDCVVTKAIDADTTPGAVYDHIAGPTSIFFIKAVQ